MSDIKQVKYDIERCISHVPDACRDCSHYTGTVGFGCMENLMADAYVLLKEQEECIKNTKEQMQKIINGEYLTESNSTQINTQNCVGCALKQEGR